MQSMRDMPDWGDEVQPMQDASISSIRDPETVGVLLNDMAQLRSLYRSQGDEIHSLKQVLAAQSNELDSAQSELSQLQSQLSFVFQGLPQGLQAAPSAATLFSWFSDHLCSKLGVEAALLYVFEQPETGQGQRLWSLMTRPPALGVAYVAVGDGPVGGVAAAALDGDASVQIFNEVIIIVQCLRRCCVHISRLCNYNIPYSACCCLQQALLLALCREWRSTTAGELLNLLCYSPACCHQFAAC
jgi:hypothetical protein